MSPLEATNEWDGVGGTDGVQCEWPPEQYFTFPKEVADYFNQLPVMGGTQEPHPALAELKINEE